ncbi:MAG: GNAT family N-acetyltransferase [Xanthomonadales bacterium]|nr:GNAT family N-acetyltransferase [Xanthomonadales bacterium]
MSRRTDPVVRRATLEDAPVIARFNQAMARETEGKELDAEVLAAGVRAVFDDPNRGFYLVAESDECVAGCLMITYEWSDWRNGMFWWIQSVYVHPDFRREGIYRTLYAEARAMGRKAGAIGFRLYVETENSRAQQTYAALGMERCAYAMFEELL